MLTSGKVAYEVGGNLDATCFGGIAAVHRLVTKLGLVDQINDGLHLLKVHLPYHESDHVLNLTYNVMCGGTRLEDIERLRHDTAYMNALGADLIPDPTTAGDFCRRFAEDDVVELMEAINAVRPQLWTGRGGDLLAPIAYIDADGTIAPTSGRRKAGMDMSYNRIWGYAPLIVSLANTKEVLYLVNRPGNAPSHQDAASWIDKAIDLVRPHADRVCLRGDTDFSLTANFDRWANKVDFIFGMDNNTALRARAEALAQTCWTRMRRDTPGQNATGQTRARRDNHKQAIVAERGYLNLELNYEDVACFDYQPGKCDRSYRVVALRKN
ncbi:IS1380 family transposase, partial [Actinopolymorpha pittospori]